MDYNNYDSNNNNYNNNNNNNNNQINLDKLNIKKKNNFLYKFVFFVFVSTIMFLAGAFFTAINGHNYYKDKTNKITISTESPEPIITTVETIQEVKPVQPQIEIKDNFAEQLTRLDRGQPYNKNNLSFQEEFYDYNGIIINTINSNISIETNDGDEDCIYVDISGKRFNDFYVYETGSVLVIDELENSSSSSIKINVCSSSLSYAQVKSIRGNIEIKDMNLADLSVNSTNGNIMIKSSDLELLNIENISGNINVNDVDVTSITNVSSTSGNVLLNDTESTSLVLQNISGTIEVKDTKTENIQSSTISGFQKIQLKKSEPLNIYLDTISNNIDCKFDERQLLNNNSQTRIEGNFKFDKESSNVFVAFSQSGFINVNH